MSHLFKNTGLETENILCFIYYKLIGQDKIIGLFPDKAQLPALNRLYACIAAKLDVLYGKAFIEKMNITYAGSSHIPLQQAPGQHPKGMHPDSGSADSPDNRKQENADKLVKKIVASVDYGMQFLYTIILKEELFPALCHCFPGVYNAMPDRQAAGERESFYVVDTIRRLAASRDKKDIPAKGYLWDNRLFEGYQSSLYQSGNNEFSFIISTRESTFKNKIVQISIINPGKENDIIEKSCYHEITNLVIPYYGQIDYNTDVVIRIKNMEKEDS